MKTQKQLEYQAYLSTDHWKKKRLEVLMNRGCKCEKCGDWANEIHHLSYENLWNEPLNELQVLCRECHEATHKALNSLSPKDRKEKKKKIHRRALISALTRKHKNILIEMFYLEEYELISYIRYSNDPQHINIINFAANLLGFDGFHPKIVRLASRSVRPDPYKNRPVRKFSKLS